MAKKFYFRLNIVLICMISSMLLFSVAYASFTSTSTNMNNTFTAATTFPIISITPSVSPTETPTPPPTNPPSEIVVINEINWAGNNNHTGDEWIELRNMTANPVDITNWIIEGAESNEGTLTIPSGTIAANGLFLIAELAETSNNSILNVKPNLVDKNITIPNSKLKLNLKDANGILIDTADDGVSKPMAGSSATPSASMERNLIPGDGSVSASWHTATTSVNFDANTTELGTPDASND